MDCLIHACSHPLLGMVAVGSLVAGFNSIQINIGQFQSQSHAHSQDDVGRYKTICTSSITTKVTLILGLAATNLVNTIRTIIIHDRIDSTLIFIHITNELSCVYGNC